MLGELAVDHANDTVRVGGHGWIVGDHDDGQFVGSEAVDQRQHARRVGGIEVSRRLVTQQERRFRDKGTGNGHPLTLAAGHRTGQVLGPGRQPNPVERRERAVASPGPRSAQINLGQHHVVDRSTKAEQMKRLEDETDALASQRCEQPVADVTGVDTVKAVGSRRWAVETADDVEQRRLPGTRRTDDGYRITRRDNEVHVS